MERAFVLFCLCSGGFGIAVIFGIVVHAVFRTLSYFWTLSMPPKIEPVIVSGDCPPIGVYAKGFYPGWAFRRAVKLQRPELVDSLRQFRVVRTFWRNVTVSGGRGDGVRVVNANEFDRGAFPVTVILRKEEG